MLLKRILLLSGVLSIAGYCVGIYESIFLIPIVFLLCVLALILLWAVSCFICTRFVNMKKEYNESSRLYRFYTNCIIDSLNQLLRVKLRVSGKEILPKEKFLFVCNHRGAMDPLITMGVLRNYNMGFVAKKEIYKIPIISRLMHRCFCLCLNRDDIKEGAKTILKASTFIKDDKASIGIYPEGTRNTKKEMLPFMNGAFKIAKKANCPIVIATIKNTEVIMKHAPFKKTEVFLDFVGVLDKEFVGENNTAQISDKVRAIMERSLSTEKSSI
ncbi:MAG: 1-acyl-sn-glycerol-3-phosphate acyltransferase [Lachnospiraceae bacterium]|nr:1-acyl-sn-glycerol-3-phosphate acyltransferase [Lachnospiraceae bacterium]